jgi:COP9 signalosome complex subunit 6
MPRRHPLPILTISEHLTRTAMQAGSTNVVVQGALLGTQSGREIEIQNTFEFPVKNGLVDHEYGTRPLAN